MLKKVTKNNLLKFIEMKEKYQVNPDKELLLQINTFIDEVINKDQHYFRKLSSYNFNNEQLKHLL